ncbi:hypothetical protein HYQ46_002574 [Verticillium longisporum]|nr:hypothetical protein HYQ46_002574 [Verticillium longisporum]
MRFAESDRRPRQWQGRRAGRVRRSVFQGVQSWLLSTLGNSSASKQLGRYHHITISLAPPVAVPALVLIHMGID